MLRSLFPALLVCAVCSSAAISLSAQTVYDAKLPPDRFAVGAGFSNFALDWGHGRRMDGITAWADYHPGIQARLLQNLGIEIEGREIDFARPSSLPRMRQETILGGPTYRFRPWHGLHPYAKYLLGIGGIYFPGDTYNHDTRTVYAPGGGVDYRVGSRFTVRVDYEYQFWHALFGPHDLNPNGVTAGVLYRF